MVSRFSKIFCSPALLLTSAPRLRRPPQPADDIAALHARRFRLMQEQLNQLQAAQAAQAAQVAKIEAPVPVLPEKKEAPGWFADIRRSAARRFLNVSNIDQTSRWRGSEPERHADGTEALLYRRRSQVQRRLLRQPHDRFPLQCQRHQQGRAGLCEEGVSAGQIVARVRRARGCGGLAVGTVRRGPLWLSLRREHADRPDQVRDFGGLGSPRRRHVRPQFRQLCSLGDQRRRLQDSVAQLRLRSISRGVSASTRSSRLRLLSAVIRGKLGKSADNLPGPATPHRATRFQCACCLYRRASASWRSNISPPKNWNNVNTVAHDKSNGWSAFGSFAFTPQDRRVRPLRLGEPSRDINPALRGPLSQRRRRLQAVRSDRSRAGLQA